MNYKPMITAARRAAKQLARETGAPYQATLDTVAQQAGRADWNEYLSSPVPLPAEDGDDLYANGPEHQGNMRNILITGVATLPAVLAIPFNITSPYERTGWQMAQIIGFTSGMWMMATMMGIMFFQMMAVHPDVPEIGRDGKRDRYTSTNLAQYAIVFSAGALLVAYLTRDLPRANFTVAAIAAAAGLVIGAIALTIRVRTAKRALALLAINGALVATFTAMASMPR